MIFAYIASSKGRSVCDHDGEIAAGHHADVMRLECCDAPQGDTALGAGLEVGATDAQAWLTNGTPTMGLAGRLLKDRR